MKVYGELIRAQAEVLAADPAGGQPTGRLFWDSVRKVLRVYDSGAWKFANRLENVGADPGAFEGEMVWRTDLKAVRVYDGAAWFTLLTASVGAPTVVTFADSPYTMTGLEKHIEIDATAGDIVITLPDLASFKGVNYPFDRVDGINRTVIIQRAGADTFAEPVLTTTIPMDVYQSQDIFAGTTKWKVRG
jgi:hypothetical protein